MGGVTHADGDPPTTSSEATPVSASRRNRLPGALSVFIAVAMTALTLDVVSKVIVAAKLSKQMAGEQQPVRILFGAIYIDQTRNSGAAFSVGTGATVALTVVAVAVIAIILRTARRMRSSGWAVALGLVLGGALGNLIDRLFRTPGIGRGHVVDWISLFGPDGAHWPIFNLADSAIVCGAVLAAILALRGIDLDGRGARGE
jgi:signal peptidase II